MHYEPGSPLATYFVTTSDGLEFVMVAPGGFTRVDVADREEVGRPVAGCGSEEVTFLAGRIEPLPTGSLSLIARGADERSEITVSIPVVPDAGVTGLLTG